MVFDEVYAPFAPKSVISLLSEHPNWLVVRTFSKSYGLAGLRTGYALGSRGLIADLQAGQDPYPASRCTIAGALAALNDQRITSVLSPWFAVSGRG
ncbi:MAG: aminotransferase class I/II-fold pyridoxal phosphate-dependent enzyme [Egibacteraceae bacterium]